MKQKKRKMKNKGKERGKKRETNVIESDRKKRWKQKGRI